MPHNLRRVHVKGERCDLPLGLYELAIKNGIEKNVKKETGCDVYWKIEVECGV